MEEQHLEILQKPKTVYSKSREVKPKWFKIIPKTPKRNVCKTEKTY
jgi:hypothetical protein